MAQQLDTSLEGRVRDLESQLRALRTTNLTDLASVVNAQGDSVPLSSLAFGLVATEIVLPVGGSIDVTKAAHDTGGQAGTGFRARAEGPRVDVYVAGGRLRVDVSSAILVSGASTIGFFGHTVLGPATDPAALGSAPVAKAATTYAAFSVAAYGGSITAQGIGSNFDTYDDLAPGWYRVEGRYAVTYPTSAPGTASGTFWGCRLAAQPY